MTKCNSLETPKNFVIFFAVKRSVYGAGVSVQVLPLLLP